MSHSHLYHVPLSRTKIVCTIGPSCWDNKTLLALTEHGMDIARLNFSHGDRTQHQDIIDRITKINDERDIPVGIMLDTKGAEIRTGDVQKPICVSEGEEVIFSSHALLAEKQKVIQVSYDGFAKDVLETKTILIDNGEISFDIIDVRNDGSVLARALQNGEIGSRRHINLPGADIDLPSITESDWDDISFGAKQNIDFIALSFIRNADEVHSVRKMLKTLHSTSKIIAKIETQKAVENIQEIIDASDAIMVARGDLGADIPFEEVPAVQDEIVCRCKDASKPVIIATHMLESMIKHPVPTRAEVTDTAHAVATGADATMLSGETASGIHPVLALQAMKRIHRATEQHLSRLETIYDIHFRNKSEEEMNTAVMMAEEHKVDAIILLTDTGRTAKNIAKFRPPLPIISLVKEQTLCRELLLFYGIYPLYIEDHSIKNGITHAVDIGLIQKGQKILVLNDRANKPEVLVV